VIRQVDIEIDPILLSCFRDRRSGTGKTVQEAVVLQAINDEPLICQRRVNFLRNAIHFLVYLVNYWWVFCMTRQNVVEIIWTARTWIKKSGWKTQLYRSRNPGLRLLNRIKREIIKGRTTGIP
jgi:hypothetical protein